MNLRTLCKLLFLVAALTGCGGGSGGATLSGIEGSGSAPKRITSSGAITATGSIFVNGIEYDLGGASISIDGTPASESDLAVGAVVIVEGELDTTGSTGDANRVSAGIAVAGRIDVIDHAALRLTILGQVILVDANTRFANAAEGQPMGGLDVGDDVEVLGFTDSTGVLSARHIAPRKSSTPLRVTGYAQQVDAAQHRFVINGQTIDYANATLTGFSGRALAGAPVRVDADDIDAQGALHATDVVYRPPELPGNAGDLAALQGWVTRFASVADFDVDGHPVVTTSSTQVIGPVNDVVGVVRLDAFIEVEGQLLANGVVQAAEIRTNNLISMDAVVWGKRGSSIVANLWRGWQGSHASECNTNAWTSVSIDDVPSSLDALQTGDVATIYSHARVVAEVAQDQCEIVAVQHNVRGPLESKPTDSLSFYVMGQRVWLDPARDADVDGQTGFDSLGSLNVGDIVEVSGHTTAEGDILATSIHAGSATGSYRVIGLARQVSSSLHRFQLGELTVDYQGAGLAGFGANGAVERDRVLVIGDAPPSGGVLRADIVRYTGDLPRGNLMNFVRYNGLMTRVAAPDNFDLEGRRVVPVDPPWPWNEPSDPRCDRSKYHANLSSMYMLGLGWGPGQFAHYGFSTCPPGRRIDQAGPNAFDGGTIGVSGPVQAIDLDKRVIRVAGIDLLLQPATRITDFEASSDPSGEVTTPILLSDLNVGDRVKVSSEVVAEFAGGIAVWRGAGAVPPDEVRIESPLVAVEEPDLVLPGGIRVQVSPATVFQDCAPISAEEFWSTAATAFPRIVVTGAMNGSELQTQIIDSGESCGGPNNVDAGPDQTVVAGDQVNLEASWTPPPVDFSSCGGHGGECYTTPVHIWTQIAGPTAILDAPPWYDNPISFVAPAVSEPVDLVFVASFYDGDTWPAELLLGRDTVTIHVLPG